MPSIAPEAEKQSASTFKWVVNDAHFTTKTGISNRNLRVTDSQVGRDSELKNMGKILTARTPKEVDASRTNTSSLNVKVYDVKSAELTRGGINSRDGTSSKNNFYSFGGKANNVAEDRAIFREPKRHLTERDYGRICCEVKPVSTATTISSRKLQDYSLILENTAAERGGLSTRNFVKDSLKP